MNATPIDAGAVRHLLTSAPPPRLVDVRTAGEFDSVPIVGSLTCAMGLALARLPYNRGAVRGPS